jgi:hypothetical protein
MKEKGKPLGVRKFVDCSGRNTSESSLRAVTHVKEKQMKMRTSILCGVVVDGAHVYSKPSGPVHILSQMRYSMEFVHIEQTCDGGTYLAAGPTRFTRSDIGIDD